MTNPAPAPNGSLGWLKGIVAMFKTPQAAVSTISTLVAVLGTAGILNSGQSGAVATLLTAVLGVLTAFGHVAAQNHLANKN